jgi:hypothetical protein
MSQLFYVPQAVRVDSTGTPYGGAKAHFYLTGTTTQTDTYTDAALTTPHANPVISDSGGQFNPIYLDPAITYRCVLTESNDTQISDTDPVGQPIDGTDILIADAGGYFAATNVETVLQEVGSDFSNLGDNETRTGDLTFSGADINMADNVISRPEITDFGITHNAVTQSPVGTLTLDLTTGNSFYHLLTANVTTFNLDFPPATGTFGQATLFLQQDGGGAYEADFSNENCIWAGGTAPTISTGNDVLDVITFMTYDAGTTWFSNYAQAYA